jgi:cell division FtsZ-interacting protein ZapD
MAETVKHSPDRHSDTERNKIINRVSGDLENIINGHDPEIHNLNHRVWDRLDAMAVEIERRANPHAELLADLEVQQAWLTHWMDDVKAGLKPTLESLEKRLAAVVALRAKAT